MPGAGLRPPAEQRHQLVPRDALARDLSGPPAVLLGDPNDRHDGPPLESVTPSCYTMAAQKACRAGPACSPVISVPETEWAAGDAAGVASGTGVGGSATPRLRWLAWRTPRSG